MKVFDFIFAWRFRLYFRTAVLMLILTLLSLSVVGNILFGSVRKILEEQFSSYLQNTVLTVEQNIDPAKLQIIELTGNHTKTYSTYLAEIDDLRHKLNLRRIFIFNSDWQSILDTDSSISFKHRYYDLLLDSIELQSISDSNVVTSRLFEDRQGRLFKRAYIKERGNEQSYFIAIELTNNSLIVWKKVRNLFLIFSGGIVVFSFISAYFFSRSISVPVKKLVKTARAIEKGNLSDEITISMKDEIGILAENLEKMRKSILRKEEQQKMVMSGINHELRNPLGGIEMFASIIANEAENEALKSQAEKILKEINHTKKILQDFNDFGKTVKPKPEKCDLERFIHESKELLSTQLELKKIRLKIIKNGGDYSVNFDPGHLRQVIVNVLKNSVQFVPEDGNIVVSLKNSEEIIMDVRDDGPGVALERQQEIFLPFYSSKEGHTGLGLAIVRNLMEENKGNIEYIESEHGAWFRLSFKRENKS